MADERMTPPHIYIPPLFKELYRLNTHTIESGETPISSPVMLFITPHYLRDIG
jgi:hypothetical protein